MKDAPEKKPDILDGLDEFIVVPRSFIRHAGWPDRWVDLDALVRAETEGFGAFRLRKGDVCQKAFQGLNVAYFRHGSNGEAFLYAQCWTGAA